MKKRLELYNNLVENIESSYSDLLPEVLKRLSNFVDINDLKSDFINVLEKIYNNYGYKSIEDTVALMTDRQLEQLKDKIAEVKNIIESRTQIKDK